MTCKNNDPANEVTEWVEWALWALVLTTISAILGFGMASLAVLLEKWT